MDLACAQLIARANERGGRDNVTVIVARVGGPQAPESREDEDLSKTFRTLISYKPRA